MPTVQDVRHFWTEHVNNEYYTSQRQGTPEYFAEIERKRYRHHYHLAALFERLARNPATRGKSLLEIGCGIGIDTVQLHRAGFAVTAIDLTKNAIAIAKERARREQLAIDYRTGNAEELPFAPESFDVVYSFGVLHHTPDIQRAVAEVHRVLRPGGTALVMLYARWSLVNGVHKLLRIPYESPKNLKDHCPVVYTFTRGQLEQLFAPFSRRRFHKAYPFTYGFRAVTGWLPMALVRPLGRIIGWHWMIEAVK